VALVVGLLSNTSWNLFWSSRALIKHLGIRPRLVFNREVVKFMWVTTLPFAAAGIFARVYSYIDSVMLSKFADDVAVGLYGSANKLTFAFIFLPASFAAALYPAMSEYFVKDRVRLAGVYENAVRYLLLVVMPIAFGIAVLSEPVVLLIYGPEFAEAAPPLRIMIFALIFGFLYWPTGSLLNASNRQVMNTTAMGITVVANVSLNLYLLPRYGAIGAATAALITNALLFILSSAFLWGVIKVDAVRMTKAVVKTLFAASFMALSVTLLRPHLNLPLLILSGAAVYVLVIFGVRGVTVAEAKSMLNLFLKRTGERNDDI
jgi:O-antigen/teichoic acid export membrane protein